MTDSAATILQLSAPRLRVVDEGSLDVVVCCASDLIELVLCAFPGLVAERLLPRAVGGIEDDVAPLTNAIARASGPTMFVLCIGPGLGGPRTRKLVEAFAAHRDPLHRLLVLDVDPDHGDSLCASIVQAANGMRRKLVSYGTGIDAMRHSGGAPVVAGVVAGPAAASGDPAVPRSRVVVSDHLRDEVGQIPEHVRAPETKHSRPFLRLVPDIAIDEEPADPAAITARMPLVLEPTPRSVAAPHRGTPWITAGAVVGTIAAVLAFRPGPGVATQLTAGLAALETVEVVDLPVAAAPLSAAPSPIAAAVEQPSADADADADADALDIALADRRIRGLDLLFVTPPYRAPSTWRTAATRCKSRSVNGVRGWRLPRVDELRKLWRHQMLDGGVFWTSARAPAAEVPSNLTFDSATARVVPLPKNEGADTICVRVRPPSS